MKVMSGAWQRVQVLAGKLPGELLSGEVGPNSSAHSGPARASAIYALDFCSVQHIRTV